MSDSMHISDPAFAPGVLVLPPDEVRVWQIDLEAVAPAESRWRGLLSPNETARADRFRVARARQNYTATRALLRIILGRYIACDPKALTFVYGDRDKPALGKSHDASWAQFNVSHSGARALLAFAHGRPIGVDIEQIRNNVDHAALARNYFSPAEQKALADLNPSERCRGFFRCWTRKEAYIKAHGAGLSLPLDSFDVSLSPGEQCGLLATRPDGNEAARWLLRDVDADEGYEAAVCVMRNGRR